MINSINTNEPRTTQNSLPTTHHTYHPRPTTQNSLPTTHYTYHPLPTSQNSLPTTHYTYHPLPTTQNSLPTTHYMYLPSTSHCPLSSNLYMHLYSYRYHLYVHLVFMSFFATTIALGNISTLPIEKL